MKIVMIAISVIVMGCANDCRRNQIIAPPLILDNYAYMESSIENCAFVIKKSLIKEMNLDMGDVVWKGVESEAIDSLKFTFTGRFHISLIDGTKLTMPDDKYLFTDGYYHGCFLLQK
jgi:hypothetical protein